MAEQYDEHINLQFHNVKILKLIYSKYSKSINNPKKYLLNSYLNNSNSYNYSQCINVLESIYKLLKLNTSYLNILEDWKESFNNNDNNCINRTYINNLVNKYFKKMTIFLVNNFEYDYLYELVKNSHAESNHSILFIISIYTILTSIKLAIYKSNSFAKKFYPLLVKENLEDYSEFQTIKNIFIANPTKLTVNSHLSKYITQNIKHLENGKFNEALEIFYLHCINKLSKFRSLFQKYK